MDGSQNKHLTDWSYLNISQRAAMEDEMTIRGGLLRKNDEQRKSS